MIRKLFAKTNHLGIANLNLALVPLTADARFAGWVSQLYDWHFNGFHAEEPENR
jgi:hypothetical protein